MFACLFIAMVIFLFRIASNIWNSGDYKSCIASAAYVKDSLWWSNHCCRLHETSSHKSSWSMLIL